MDRETKADKLIKAGVFTFAVLVCIATVIPITLLLNLICIYFDMSLTEFLIVLSGCYVIMGVWFKDNLTILYRLLYR